MSPYSVAAFLLVPPGNLLVVAIAGFVSACRGRAIGRWLLGFSLCGLLVLSMPFFAETLLASLEQLPASQALLRPPGAIVILSGDVRHLASGDPDEEVGPLTLERLRAGAALYRSTHLPVLTTGGIFDEQDPAIADLMAQSLANDFAVPTRWIENASRNTWENAERSAAILKAQGIDSVFLVTHAWHMRRAMMAFRHFGITVTAAPVPPEGAPRFQLAGLLPEALAWRQSYFALHEWIGCAWYALREYW